VSREKADFEFSPQKQEEGDEERRYMDNMVALDPRSRVTTEIERIEVDSNGEILNRPFSDAYSKQNTEIERIPTEIEGEIDLTKIEEEKVPLKEHVETGEFGANTSQIQTNEQQLNAVVETNNQELQVRQDVRDQSVSQQVEVSSVANQHDVEMREQSMQANEPPKEEEMKG